MKNKKILLRVIGIPILVGLLIIGVSAVTFYGLRQHLKTQLLQNYADQEKLVGQEVASTLTAKAVDIQSDLKLIATDPTIAGGGSKCGASMANYYKPVSHIIEDLALVSPDGTVHCSSNPAVDGQSFSAYDPVFAASVQKPTHTPMVSHLIKSGLNPGQYVVVTAVPMYAADGSYKGVIVAGIDLKKLASNYLNTISFAHSGRVSVIDNNGGIVFAKTAGLTGQNFYSAQLQSEVQGLNGAVANGLKGHSSIVQYTRNGVKKIAAVQPMYVTPGHPWLIVVNVPVKDVASLFIDPVANSAFNVASAVLIIAVSLIVIIMTVSSFRELELRQAKDQFVSLTSHQLRTPLTAIRLFSEMLADGQVGKLNAGQADYVAKIETSTERMIRLVGDILNVSRVELKRIKVNPEPLELNAFIQSHLDELQPLAAAKKVGLTSHLLPHEQLIPADPILLGQIVHNLLTNAIRYVPADSGKVELTLRRDAKNYVLQVSDNGIGIPPSARKRIFSQFYRAENAKRVEGEGTGLGLYLVKAIVDLTGCKISYDSIEKVGTSFYVTIPSKGMIAQNGDRSLS